MKISNEYLLYRKWFLFSLIILILNDFYLKYQFHNTITGKLSDFTGLFVFPYFISLFFKNIKRVYFLTVLFFVFWKSEFSQPIIDSFNFFGIAVNRVVDYTDLIAFSILPLSYFYRTQDKQSVKVYPIFSYAIILISCFSFVATTLASYWGDINKKSDLTLEVNKSIIDFKADNNIIIHSNNKAEYSIDLSEHTKVFYLLEIKKKNDSITNVKIDSVLNFIVFGRDMFRGIDDDRVKQLHKMKKEDFEKIFLKEINKIK